MTHKIVAIGASAGGLEALESFLNAIPSDAGMAFVVIQHLSPDHKSRMADLLAGYCKLPIMNLEDGQYLEPNMVYLSPAGFVPIAEERLARLVPRPSEGPSVLPINSYFKSLADTLGERAVGVILSGTGSDGTEGAKQIRARGGQVYAQSPAEAAFSGMPQSVISADLRCTVSKAGALWPLIANTDSNGQELEALAAYALEDSASEDADGAEAVRKYRDFFAYLRELFDIDFSEYRFKGIKRRVQRRMSLLAIPSIKDYLAYLKDVKDEARALHRDLLIGVTEFLRDEASYKVLAAQALEPLFKQATESSVRIWSAGCATGEEAYSLYIIASETARKVGYEGAIQIFATDVSQVAIDKAALGCFPEEELEPLGEDRKARYFERCSHSSFKVKDSVRESIVFAQHNFMMDPPFTKIDLVTCRNVLIYLTPQSQEVAVRAFSYALREGGYLFLGASEGLGKCATWYAPLDKQKRIFQRVTGGLDSNLWVEPKIKARIQKYERRNAAGGRLQSATISKDLLNAYDALLKRVSVNGFLINREHEILHYFGSAADYCINLQGRLSTDLPSQLDKTFRLALIALTHRTLKNGKRCSSSQLKGSSRKGDCCVDLSVEPLMNIQGTTSVLLVEIVEREERKSSSPESSSASAADQPEVLDRYRLLEQELTSTKESLVAANEELQVSNEELQALNQEVQVSNEELHSTNEELTALNEEFGRKNRELLELNASHSKLLQSTEDGVLYVGSDMRIKRFNHAIASAFQLMPNDVGRELAHMAYRLDNNAELIKDVQSVLEGGDRVERESIEIEGRRYMKRVVPYRGEEDLAEGALITFTDITEVSALNQRFELAVQAAHMSWWDWNLENGDLNVHSAGDCILGDECLSTSRDREGWMSLVHPDDKDLVAVSLDAHLAGESDEWVCEHRFKAESGDWLWVSNRGLVTRRDTGGNALEMMGTTQDIDSYKKSIIEANYQREIMDSAGDVARLGCWDYDVDTKRLNWSYQIYRIMGVDMSYDPNLEDTFAFFPPKVRMTLMKAFEKTLEEGTPYDLELECINLQGKHLITRTSGRAQMDRNGQVFKIVGVFQDVTDILQKEHEMQAYFSLSPDFQATLDFEGRFTTLSPSWSEQLGYPSVELRALPILQIVHPDDREDFNQQFQKVLKGDSVSSYSTRIWDYQSMGGSDSEEEIWMSWSLASDEPLGLVFVSARCVTEERKAKQKLKTALIKAEEANRAKSDFLAVMSHELRTPLNPILGFSELLLEEVEQVEHKEILETIVESGKHLIKLIDEVLDFSKVEAAKVKVEQVEFSLEKLLNEKLRLMRGQLKGKKVELRLESNRGPFEETGLPIFVGDESMLRHILRNLISNAIKFTEEGYVVVRFSVDSAAEGGAILSLEVEDTGIGIDPSQHEKVFDAFTQADASMTRQYGGTGLGLAICKRLVELMNGSISLRSELGKGSLFRVQVPFCYREEKSSESAVDTAGDAELAPSQETQFSGSKTKHKILVVEDNLNNQYFLKQLLTRIGYDPVLASNGEDALEIFRREDVEVGAILLDLHMPGIGGIDTLVAIREFEATSGSDPTPVFILTADVQDKTREACLAHGADSFITKPVGLDVLRHALAGLKPGS